MAKAKKNPPQKNTKKLPKKQIKPAASKNREDATLHKAFVKSLVNLQSYWDKKVSQLKKQLETLKAKQKKASAKIKALKLKSDTSKKNPPILVAEITQAQDALEQAKLALNKYVSLRKVIDQFERDWLKTKITPPTQVAPAPLENKMQLFNDIKALPNEIFEEELDDAGEPDDLYASSDDGISELEVIEDFSSNFLEEDDLDEDYT